MRDDAVTPRTAVEGAHDSLANASAMRFSSYSRNAVLCAFAVILAGCASSGSGPLAPPVGHGASGPPWSGFARNAQHTALSPVAGQPLARIHWSTPVDLAPQYSGTDLLIHYGSPVVTMSDTVIVPVKTGAAGGFRIDAHDPVSGGLIWSAPSDYVLPSAAWTPSFNPALAPSGRLYFPGSGGKLFYRDKPDVASGQVGTAVFFGAAAYQAAKSTYDADIRINTPITIDASGDAYFGFLAIAATPAHLVSGLARIDANGNGAWVSAAAASGDATMTQIPTNCAPAISNDGSTVYIAVNRSGSAGGYLVALNSATLVRTGRAILNDPVSGQPAVLPNISTASPTVGPDGDVYFGVFENPFPEHNDRGWLLHFDSSLAQQKIPGSFGWDDTASVVPASMVPAYSGTSPYLLMSKYNDYAGIGTGTGQNRIAILDPNATEPDPITGNPVMKEVYTILGVTPDPNNPGGVREWCINTAAVDFATKSVVANSEDGTIYRWDLTTNTFSQRLALTAGIGEAYTPTSIGPDGQIYAISNARLYVIGL